MPTITKDIDGEEREIEVTADDFGGDTLVMDRSTLDDQYVKRESYEREIDRVKDRFRSKKLQEAKDQLREDEDFIQSILNEHGGDDERIQTLQAEKDKLESKLNSKAERLQELETNLKGQAVREAAEEAGIAEQFRARPNGKPSYVERTVLDDMDVERVDGQHVVVNSDGDRIPAPADSDNTFMSVSEYLTQDTFDDLRGETSATRGSGFESGGRSGAAGKDWEDMSQQEKLAHLKETGGEHPAKIS